MLRLIILLTTFSLSADAPDRLVLPKNLENNYPFSDAVKVGNLLFISGLVGENDENIIVEGGLVAETHQIFVTMITILKEYDLSLEDVVKCTVFLDNVDEWGKFNTIYTQYFTKPYPARSALGADGLALGASLELECIAQFK